MIAPTPKGLECPLDESQIDETRTKNEAAERGAGITSLVLLLLPAPSSHARAQAQPNAAVVRVEQERRTYELERLKRDASVSLAKGDYEKASQFLRDAISYESVPATYLALGFARMAAGHHAEAIGDLKTARQLEAGQDVHRYLAEAYKAVGRLDESRSESETYQRLIQRLKKERLAKIAGGP